jgi:hypothetical protein
MGLCQSRGEHCGGAAVEQSVQQSVTPLGMEWKIQGLIEERIAFG